MSDFTGDGWIDEELKNVPLPADLFGKLQAIALLDDAELDRALCNVAVPAGLFDRLRAIGTLDESDLEDELRHVVVPGSLLDRLRRIPAAVRHVRGEHKHLGVRHFAIAASLLVAVGVGYLAVVSSSWFATPNKRIDQKRELAKGTERTSPTPVNTGRNVARVRPSDDENFTFPPLALPAPDNVAVNQREATQSNIPSTPVATPQETMDMADEWPTTIALGAPTAGDNLPPLRSLAPPVWRGVLPPRERGYDLSFQLKHGVHPRVSLATSPGLAVSQVPLVTSTASFDAAHQMTRDRKLPPGHRIRTEEFLAAMDYGFAPPQNRRVAIRSSVGPSPWAPGLSLLQVAAQASHGEGAQSLPTEKSQVVAKRATMKVTFKPDAVAMYRLLGHEATSVAGLINSTVEVDLRSGDAATGLFEVELKPDGGDEIATVEVSWHHPTSGAVETDRQTVSRLQHSPSFYQAPLSLQLAALAAETAEILRGSYFAPPNSHSLSGVAELGAQLNPRLHSRPSFVKLMTLIDQAQRSQPASQ